MIENLHFRYMYFKKFIAQTKTRAFITQCGVNSITEALYAGVPVVCIPFFCDQHYNAAVVEYKGVGVWLDKLEINRQTMSKVLEDVLDSRFTFFKVKVSSGKILINKPHLIL